MQLEDSGAVNSDPAQLQHGWNIGIAKTWTHKPLRKRAASPKQGVLLKKPSLKKTPYSGNQLWCLNP